MMSNKFTKELLTGLCGTLSAIAIISIIFIKNEFPGSQCPVSTFQSAGYKNGSEVLFATIFGLFSLIILLACTFQSYNASGFSKNPNSLSSLQPDIQLISLSILFFIASSAAYIDSVYSYSCLTPNQIIIRSGYLDAPQNRSWDDLKIVRAWCWKSSARTGPQYHGSTLTLSLDDGVALPFGLVNGRQILMSNYQDLKNALKDKDYRYYADASVTPALCPEELYPLLKGWHK